ncbi:hypothetical protein SeLEV6574_g03865 [Synchytrium endobioticum]|uniref:Uncharacterized protein n=1 Tax=Synchytrium endobioticum TaxID=286115 RepID=A0A507D2F0_9FUNG|nr:hypothetical protein SeLEV6574_g03865 [Synchytrium endobioticum]
MWPLPTIPAITPTMVVLPTRVELVITALLERCRNHLDHESSHQNRWILLLMQSLSSAHNMPVEAETVI